MNHLRSAAIATLLALMAYTQYETTESLHSLTQTVMGHEGDLRVLQDVASGRHPVVPRQRHVEPDTLTPFGGQDSADNCATLKNCPPIPPLIREF